MIQELAKALTQQGSRLHFEMCNAGEGSIRVRVTPDLGPAPSDASDEEIQLRAAITSPLSITGSPAEVEASLANHLGQQREIVAEGVASISALRERLNAATAKAQQAKPSAGNKGSKASSPATPSASQTKADTAPLDAGDEKPIQQVNEPRKPTFDDF